MRSTDSVWGLYKALALLDLPNLPSSRSSNGAPRAAQPEQRRCTIAFYTSSIRTTWSVADVTSCKYCFGPICSEKDRETACTMRDTNGAWT